MNSERCNAIARHGKAHEAKRNKLCGLRAVRYGIALQQNGKYGTVFLGHVIQHISKVDLLTELYYFYLNLNIKIMKFKTRLLVFLLMCAFPYALLELFKTESTTEFLWWEDILGFIAVGCLGLTWIHFWFKKLLSK